MKVLNLSLVLTSVFIAIYYNSKMAAFRTRGVVKTILSVEQSEGMGARVRRSIGRPELKNFDPFLMLDEFKVAVPAGFPDHPHRGFETVTYLLPTSEGTFRHEDFNGHQAQLSPGGMNYILVVLHHCENFTHADDTRV